MLSTNLCIRNSWEWFKCFPVCTYMYVIKFIFLFVRTQLFNTVIISNVFFMFLVQQKSTQLKSCEVWYEEAEIWGKPQRQNSKHAGCQVSKLTYRHRGQPIWYWSVYYTKSSGLLIHVLNISWSIFRFYMDHQIANRIICTNPRTENIMELSMMGSA